ncbi:MAG: class I SAM-dependent methyltransferase [Hyphomicrobiales bacterium]
MTDTQAAAETTRTRAFKDGFIERAGRALLPNTIKGSLSITFPNGRTAHLGTPGAQPHAELVLKNYRVINNAMRRASIGFAESYMAGDVDIPDIVSMIRFFIQNRAKFMDNPKVRALFKVRLGDKLWHRSRRNSPARSKDNIEAHYDLGNAFYEAWLDKSMTYSSALFKDETMAIEEAQAAKYQLVAAALDLPKDAQVLEIGCGWGGFAEHVMARGDLRYTGITLSSEQLAFARNRIGSEHARFHLLDYRHAEGRFDGIASIEMIEAVGEEHWDTYFKLLHDRLKPGAKAAIQAITIDEAQFDTYLRKVDFIQRYVFPGGMLPTVSILREKARTHGLEMAVAGEFGESYAKTLNAWRAEFDASWDEIKLLGFDERFRRMWRYYLEYCEAGFLEGVIDVGVYSFTRPKGE